MYLAYVDDSGDSKHGTTLTALLVEAQHWAGLLDAWLTGRREVHQQFGVRKHAELHATALYKGRGRFCETTEQEKRFGTGLRGATGRIVLSHLSRFDHFHVITVGSQIVSKPTLYAMFVAHLEDWAALGPRGPRRYALPPGPSRPGHHVAARGGRRDHAGQPVQPADPGGRPHRLRRVPASPTAPPRDLGDGCQARRRRHQGVHDHEGTLGTRRRQQRRRLAYCVTQEPPAEAGGPRGARPLESPRGAHGALR